MGVPGLLRWLQKQFPSACTTARRLDTQQTTQSLFIDLNSTLHQGARDSNGDVRTICSAIDQIVRQINPSGLLYLAIDGVPPRMKERLQRQRRIRSAEIYGKQGVAETPVFSSYAITPGTPWMRRVESRIVEFIELKRRVDGRWKRLRVVFSGSGDPGEGEQKIMAYLRTLQASEGDSHCVWSNDADTVLLSLAARVPRIRMVSRHGSLGLPGYTVVDIDELARKIAARYMPPDGCGDLGLAELVDQLVFMTFFAGNDFLPPSPFVQVGADAECIGMLWRAYAGLPAKHRRLHSAGVINIQAFRALLQMFVASGEERGFRQHVGATALGSHLTAMRARRIEWASQSKQLLGSTSSAEMRGQQACQRQKKKKSKTGQHVPFVWVGNVGDLELPDQIKQGVSELPESLPLRPEQHVAYCALDECGRAGRAQLELDGLPLVPASLLAVVKATVDLATGNSAPLFVESLEHIGSSKLRWLPSFAGLLQVDCKVIAAADAEFDGEYERLKRYRACAKSPSTSSENNGLRIAQATTTFVIGELGLHPPTHFIRLCAQKAAAATAAGSPALGRPPSMHIALVGDCDWTQLLADAKTERKRSKELDRWKTTFYKRHYPSCSDTPGFVDNLCTHYANALGWTALYYFAGTVSSWEFAWPAEIESSLLGVGPLGTDLLRFLEQADRWQHVPVSEALPPMLLEHQLSVLPLAAWSGDDQKWRPVAEALRDGRYSDAARSQVRQQLLADSDGADASPCVYFWFF
ncbi:hypothetical protein LPJ56_000145 [Coemansia sp. RSA 2599]|nr:hypothetical protein LPJ75_000048 [Coemansia sp. RSA 2598]KAJ1829626.1 hypothetical protein LPJ56_000145 [Coemansia sp. RSA 2599]